MAFTLGAVALFALGATSSTDCLSSLVPIIVPPLTVSVHVINDAYDPVSVQLVTDAAGGASLVNVNSIAATEASAYTDSPATQPVVGGTVAEGEDVEIGSPLCAVILGPIAVKATYTNSSDVEISATSAKLYLDNDFACGDRVTFIIRPAAMVGIVVGHEIVQGGAG